MSNTVIEQTTTNQKAEGWAERIATQQRSGIFVKQFCKERGLTILLRRLAQAAPGKGAGTIHPPASVQVYLCLTPCEHAQELRQSARASTRAPEVGPHHQE